MPTEPVAALLYLCLLLPGIAFIWNYEGHRPSIKRSVFRETATVLIASAASLVSVFIVFYIAGFYFESFRKALQQFFIDPQAQLRADSQAFFGVVLVSMIAAVVLGAFYGSATAHADVKAIRRWISKVRRKSTPTMERGLSAWSAAFESMPDHHVNLGVQLKSGTWIQGRLFTYNQDGDDGPERALTLNGGILYRLSNGENVNELEGFSMAVVHASDIEFLAVGHERRADGGSSTPTAAP